MHRLNLVSEYKSPPPFFTPTMDSDDEAHSVAQVHRSGGGNSNPRHTLETRPDWDEKGRHRNWVFTLYDVTAHPNFGNSCKYYVYQLEICPTTGRQHFQGYIQLENPKGLGGMKLINKHAHWEPRWGTHEQARNYCRKDESRVQDITERVGPWEAGTPSIEQGKRNDIHRAVDLIREGKSNEDMAEETPEIIMKYHRGIEALRGAMRKHRHGEMPEVCIIYGPSGSGKTHYVYEKHGWDNVYSVTSKDYKWWDGYNQHQAVLFDEAEFNMGNYSMFTQLCDQYPYQVEIKGGFVKFKSPYIYFVNSVEKKAKAFLHGDMQRRISRILRFKSDHTYVEEPREILPLPVPGDMGFPSMADILKNVD